MVASAEQELAKVMDRMPYGLYIVGTRSADGEVNGMMADWVMQVSFNPRQVAVSFENDAHSLENLRSTGNFTLNVLGQDHEGMEIAQHFAQPYLGTKIRGRMGTAARGLHRKLADLPHFRAPGGCPVLNAAIAWAECRAEQFVPVGDHTLVIARAVAGQAMRDAETLTSTYTGWPYSG
jgi:flavin reductase (DIM6/NTAB) family NADH-FMN oxidoreductase RutF